MSTRFHLYRNCFGFINTPLCYDSDSSSCKFVLPEQKEDRFSFVPNQPEQTTTGKADDYAEMKPPYSFVSLISMAILSSNDQQMLVGDIYRFIMENFPFYNNFQKTWRNSIRQILSTFECFVKRPCLSHRGSYWMIHHACVQDFARGNYKHRLARRRNTKCEDGVREQRSTHPYKGVFVPMAVSQITQNAYETFFNQASSPGRLFTLQTTHRPCLLHKL